MTGPRILMMLLVSGQWAVEPGVTLPSTGLAGWGWTQLLWGAGIWLVLGFIVAWIFGSLAQAGAPDEERTAPQSQHFSTNDGTEAWAAPRPDRLERVLSDQTSFERLTTGQVTADREAAESAQPAAPPSILRFDRTRRPARAQKGP